MGLQESCEVYNWLVEHTVELDEPSRREQLDDVMVQADRVYLDVELIPDESDHEDTLIQMMEG